jgi:16S rRNA processing protein RimM
VLGYVARPNGLRGAVVAHVDPSMIPSFVRGLEVTLECRDATQIATKVRSSAPVRGGVRLELDNVSDRSGAEALVGAKIRVERERLGSLAEDEYLDIDLIGLAVVTEDGRELGSIVEVMATGANDIYVVRAEGGSEILVPAVAHALVSVDLEARRVVVVAAALEYGSEPAGTQKP